VSVGVLFLNAGIAKFFDINELAEGIRNYTLHLAPNSVVRALVWILPTAETIVGLTLVANVWTSFGLVLGVALLLAFNIAVATNLRLGKRFKCHCFGVGETKIGPATLIRNFMLIIGCILVAFAKPTISIGSGSAIDSLLLLICVAGVIVVFYIIDEAAVLLEGS
jgi:uncharacterized membrane protein YphA (DoxX/SURF4 family)